jgi:hypothetical protein
VYLWDANKHNCVTKTPAAMPLLQEDPLPTVSLSSSSGCIAPDACCGVTITCAADVAGTHELLLRCTSGGQDSYVRLRVTVVVPDIQISSSRWAAWASMQPCQSRTGCA